MYQEKVKNLFKKFFLNGKKYNFGNSLSLFFFPIYILFLRKYGAFQCIKIIPIIKLINNDLALFFLAELNFYKGDYAKSLELLKSLKSKYPLNEDIYYLISKNLIRMGFYENAIQNLFSLLKISKRKKNWLMIANNINNKKQFKKFKKYFLNTYNISEITDISLVNYYSEAALNAKQYFEAKNIWTNFIKENNKIKIIKNSNNTDIRRKGRRALLHLRKVLERNEILFFIISGTLLGCIRNKDLLSYDKDIDIGVFKNDVSYYILEKIIENSGFFEIMPTKHKDYIKIKHINGIFIDIFFHYEKKDYYYHCTSKIEWKNRKFDLVRVNFLGESFFIPKDYDYYLKENYGDDWIIPKKTFNSAFDTPNKSIKNKDEMIVYNEKIRVINHCQIN